MNDRNNKVFYNSFHNDKLHPVTNFMQELRCKLLQKELLTEKGKILVVGCGSKDEMSIFHKDLDVQAIDISETAINSSRGNYPHFSYQIADAQNLPFDDNSFDSILCSEVIEHVPDQKKALQEFSRVLKKNGKLFLTTPNWLSFYGLARKIAELILRKPVTSANQPIDEWTTSFRLKKSLKEHNFNIEKHKGVWFYPPAGRGHKQIPHQITLPLFKLFYPLEKLFKHALPWFGHMIYLRSKKK